MFFSNVMKLYFTVKNIYRELIRLLIFQLSETKCKNKVLVAEKKISILDAAIKENFSSFQLKLMRLQVKRKSRINL